MQIDARINHVLSTQRSALALRQPLTPCSQASSISVHFQGEAHSAAEPQNWFQRYVIQPIQTLWTKIITFLKSLWSDKAETLHTSTPDKSVESKTTAKPTTETKTPKSKPALLPGGTSTPAATSIATASKPSADESPRAPQTPPAQEANNIRPRLQPASTPLEIEDLFGSDFTQVRSKQKGGNTCYLLASLDAILHHPQAKRILEKINFSENKDSYFVKFPGQLEQIEIPKQELGRLKLADQSIVEGVESTARGVKLIECAYSKLPSHIEIHENNQTFTEGFGQYFDFVHCLKQIFGEEAVSLTTPDDELNMLGNAKRLQTTNSDFADIWVAQKINRNSTNQPNGLESHFNSVILSTKSTPGYFEVHDPFRPYEPIVGPLETILRDYYPTCVRIKLNS